MTLKLCDVVGNYCADDGATPGCQNDDFLIDAYFMDKSGYQEIALPGSVVTVALGINDLQQMVGAFFDSKFNGQGYLREKDGEIRVIQVPGSIYTDSIGINNRGTIVGSYDDAQGNTHGYLRTAKGEFRTLDYPGGEGTGLAAINERGDIVGSVVNDFFEILHSCVALRNHTRDELIN